MEQKTFLYCVKHLNSRQERLTGFSFGVIHSDSEEHATMLLMNKMGNNAYAFRIVDATDQNREGYVGIPSGDLLAWE